MTASNKGNAIKTVLTISMGFLVLFMFSNRREWFILSLLIGLTGIFSSFLSGKIELVWMKLSWLLSLVMPNVILTVIFYLFLFPIAMLSKLFANRRSLILKNQQSSMFKTTNKTFVKADFEKPW